LLALYRHNLDEMRRNGPHVCKANDIVTPVNPRKQTLPAAVYSHGINNNHQIAFEKELQGVSVEIGF
jgi:hypothetical protein